MLKKKVSGLVIAAVVLSVVLTSVSVNNLQTQTGDPKIAPNEEKTDPPPVKKDPNKSDKTPPIIIIDIVEGDCTDENPGCWQVSAYDDESGINHDTIKVSIDGILIGNSFGPYNIPCALGDHSILVECMNDNPKNPLLGSLSKTLSIIDDDIVPPELSNLVIDIDYECVYIFLTAIDYSGFSEFKILINEELITPINMEVYGNDYTFILENQWLFESRTINVKVQAYDADNDRENDALSSSICGSFTFSIGDMIQFVIHQIEEVKVYISSHIESKYKYCLIRKLNLAQDNLEEALICLEEEDITHSLFHDLKAEFLLCSTEKKLKNSNKIPEDDIEFLIEELHIIRNYIIKLMEASLGDEFDYNIASIKITLLNLIDYIGENSNGRSIRCLKCIIRCASFKLDLTLIFLSMGRNPHHILGCTQSKLQQAICKLEKLMDKGVVSQDLGTNIKDILLQSIEDIETILVSLA
ncbi:MAG: hypothetical protein ACFE9V_20400 [Candidatus Hodarchaeota archaeon]